MKVQSICRIVSIVALIYLCHSLESKRSLQSSDTNAPFVTLSSLRCVKLQIAISTTGRTLSERATPMPLKMKEDTEYSVKTVLKLKIIMLKEEPTP